MSAGPAARTVRLRAPAKLNLGLRVLGRRPDGYHELDSVFVPLDWADDLVVELVPDAAPDATARIEGHALGVPSGPENLAVRAARAFLEAAGLRAAARVALTKHLPAAAGLGGGSSDAGAVLRALAELCPGAVAPERQAELALALGADVPFFLDPRPARVRGIGERIEALDLPGFALVLAHPGVPLATAEVFRVYDALAPGPAPSAPLDGTALDLANDLEPAAVRLCPPVARLRERLRALAPLGLGMSGSGPTVFAVFPDARTAEAAHRRLDLGPPAWSRVARSVGSR